MENYARNEEFEIIAIAKLENPSRSKKALEQRLTEFEGCWQAQLGTIHTKGLNIRNGLKRSYYKYNTSFKIMGGYMLWCALLADTAVMFGDSRS